MIKKYHHPMDIKKFNYKCHSSKVSHQKNDNMSLKKKKKKVWRWGAWIEWPKVVHSCVYCAECELYPIIDQDKDVNRIFPSKW